MGGGHQRHFHTKHYNANSPDLLPYFLAASIISKKVFPSNDRASFGARDLEVSACGFDELLGLSFFCFVFRVSGASSYASQDFMR